MDLYDESILEFWKAMDECGVEYIMVGGFATNLHGFSRMTGDIDIWLKDTLANRVKFSNAFKSLGYADMDFQDVQFIPGWTSIYLSNGIELDVMTSLEGLEHTNYDECYKLAPTAIIHGIDVKFLHINQLIEVKKAVGRPKDLLDVEELEKIKKFNEENDHHS